jgi:hypothetical protein
MSAEEFVARVAAHFVENPSHMDPVVAQDCDQCIGHVGEVTERTADGHLRNRPGTEGLIRAAAARAVQNPEARAALVAHMVEHDDMSAAEVEVAIASWR